MTPSGDRDAPGRLRARLRLMVITDPRPACGRPLPAVVEECLEAGATAVQLRDKGATSAALYRRAAELAPVARRHDALFLVNDRFDVALAAGADGVHLGPADLPLAEVRTAVPPGFVVGYSADRRAAAREAARDGADYLGVGAVYRTRSKEEAAGEAVGPERVAEVLEAAGLPGVGIGGITPENAAEVARAGAGVAVISAVMGAERPGEATRALLAAVEEGRPD